MSTAKHPERKSVSRDIPEASLIDTKTQGSSGSPGLLALLAVAVCAVVLYVHWPALAAKALCFDDGQYLLENRLVQNPSWNSVGHFFGEILEPSTVEGYYQPLAMTSLMVDFYRGGRVDKVGPFRHTSLALHVLNTVLVILFLYAVFGNAWIAALVGLLFGAHPLTVEPIPWLSERKSLLAMFFALWCLLTFVLYTRKSNWTLYGISLLMLVLALLSKPTTTPLPLLLLLLDYWPLRRLNWRAVVEKIPFIVIAGLSALITYISQKSTASATLPGAESLWRIPLTLCHNIVFYLYKVVWPTDLHSLYLTPEPFTLSHPMVLAGVLGTVVLLAALLISLRWTRAFLTGWLFFFIAIFPTMGVIGFTIVIASDKYVYLPSLGLLLIVAFVLGKLWDGMAKEGRPMVGRVAMVVVVLLLGGLEAGATRGQLAHWKDTETYYRYMLKYSPGDFRLHNTLGFELLRQKRTPDAIKELTLALEAKPEDYHAQNNMGNALVNMADTLARQGKAEEAREKLAAAKEHFEEAIRLEPERPKPYGNLARVLQILGEPEEAATHLEKAIELDPYAYDAYNSFGALLAQQGEFERAEGAFRQAIEVNAHFVNAYIGLGISLEAQGKRAEAIEVYEDAQRIEPDNAMVRGVLRQARAKLETPPAPAGETPAVTLSPNEQGLALFKEGGALFRQNKRAEAQAKFTAAREQFEQAVRLEPDNTAAHTNLARMWQVLGQPDKAFPHFQKVVELDPAAFEAHNALGVFWAMRGNLDRAERHFRQAIEANANFLKAYLDLGKLLGMQGRIEEEIKVYEKALRVAPDDARLKAVLKQARAKRG